MIETHNNFSSSCCRKKAVKSDISLEERIKQLTCGIDEDNDELTQENGEDDSGKNEDSTDLSHRDSPAGEENPQKFNVNGNSSDKSFSPNSSVSSSSSSSSAYKKITEIFNREKKNQEKIMEMEENPIVIIPQVKSLPAIVRILKLCGFSFISRNAVVQQLLIWGWVFKCL